MTSLRRWPVGRRTSRRVVLEQLRTSSSHLRSVPLIARTCRASASSRSSMRDLGLAARRSCARRSPDRRPAPRLPRPRRRARRPGRRGPRASRVGSAAEQSTADLAAALEELLLAQPLLQPLAPAAERLVDRLGRRGQPALQDRQREADRALARSSFSSASARLNSSRTYSVTACRARPRRRRACR